MPFFAGSGEGDIFIDFWVIDLELSFSYQAVLLE